MTDPSGILPLTANTAVINPFETLDTKSSVETEHVRLHQRNGRKTLTTIEGLPKEVDPKKVLKAFKKDFACNGNIVQNEDDGREIIQLQGDHRAKIASFLVESELAKKEDIQVHGF